MPRLKVKPETAHTEPEAPGVKSDSAPLKTASADMSAHQSPALALQTRLEQAWKTGEAQDTIPVAKVPFGWTLIGASIVCAAFWYVILQLVF